MAEALARAFHERGCEMSRLGVFAAASEMFRACVEALPGRALGHYNLGVALRKAGDLPASVAAFRSAVWFQPDFPEAQFNLALSLLGLGRWQEAWPLYEARFAVAKRPDPKFPFPRWQGEPLAGKSILVLHDEGLGDDIQSFRYVAPLRELGAQVGWLCRPSLAELFAANGVTAYVQRPPAHDYWIEALSLPLRFNSSPSDVPGADGYLKVPRPSPALPESLKVGLVWRGNPDHHNDAQRSIGAEALAPVLAVPGVQFVNLQRGEPHPAMLDVSAQMDTFAGTAAVIAGLDLVIAVDTSTAHLAGAMGKPCWIMLPRHETDWRWLQERTDSPLYRSVELFRQEDGWAGTVARVAERLGRFAQARH